MSNIDQGVLGLLRWATTDNQREVIQLRAQRTPSGLLSWKKISKEVDRDLANCRRDYILVERRAAKAGYVPKHGLNEALPDGVELERATIQRGPDGEIQRTWLKAKAANDARLLELLQESLETYRGRARAVKPPKAAADDLLVVYPQGDPHLGCYAWADECGDDFDTDIAERNLVEAMSRLVGCAPKAETAIILNLGDFFHADDDSGATKRNKNPLDTDSRWSRVFKMGMHAMIQCVDEARRKHSKVIVKSLIGNHDDHTSQAFAYALDAYFHNDPRVEVDVSPAKFWYYQFNKVLIGAGHGDTAKPDLLPNIMAADVPEKWGTSQHRYWYTGHIHSQNQKEYAGVIWESFKTLAGKDAWHTAQGYRSGRDMFCIVHHKDFGEIERHRVDVRMLGLGSE